MYQLEKGVRIGIKMLTVCVVVIVYMCFFFQAEDGIRDIGVTGVQTCALPISGAMWQWPKNHFSLEHFRFKNEKALHCIYQ